MQVGKCIEQNENPKSRLKNQNIGFKKGFFHLRLRILFQIEQKDQNSNPPNTTKIKILLLF